jgi:hypothetical protein
MLKQPTAAGLPAAIDPKEAYVLVVEDNLQKSNLNSSPPGLCRCASL